ncbi:MAG: hypothetical protein IPM29_22125 [Planctomycetes bacterium]|nr:hypothetical protein [Planctomycetota bacterium]
MHCGHRGLVKAQARHRFVRIAEHPVLVRPDVEGVAIDGCPNTIPPNTVKCSATLPVQGRTESHWIFVAGDPVCLSSVWGFAVCQPPLASQYRVTATGQDFVTEDP